MAAHAELEEGTWMHLVSIIGGGLCVGFGVVNLYHSFGYTGGGTERVPLNTDLTHVGFSGLDNLARLPTADFAIPLVGVGLLLMVIGNATAWKKTGGY